MLPDDLDPAQFSARRVVHRFADPATVTRAAAEEVVRRLMLAVSQRGTAATYCA